MLTQYHRYSRTYHLPVGILQKYQGIRRLLMLIALSKAKAAEAISCSIRKFDAMVLAGTMPKPRLLDEGNGGDVKKVWSAREIEEHFDRLPRDGETTSSWENAFES